MNAGLFVTMARLIVGPCGPRGMMEPERAGRYSCNWHTLAATHTRIMRFMTAKIQAISNPPWCRRWCRQVAGGRQAGIVSGLWATHPSMPTICQSS